MPQNLNYLDTLIIVHERIHVNIKGYKQCFLRNILLSISYDLIIWEKI